MATVRCDGPWPVPALAHLHFPPCSSHSRRRSVRHALSISRHKTAWQLPRPPPLPPLPPPLKTNRRSVRHALSNASMYSMTTPTTASPPGATSLQLHDHTATSVRSARVIKRNLLQAATIRYKFEDWRAAARHSVNSSDPLAVRLPCFISQSTITA